jgi:hypothetical protein
MVFAGQGHGSLGYVNGFLKMLCHHIGAAADKKAKDYCHA